MLEYTSDLQLAVDLELELRRRGIKRKPVSGTLDFTQKTYPQYSAGWFHSLLSSRLDQFLKDTIEKKSPRLIIFAPPRHGKTELVSRRFPAFAFGEHPDLSIIGASYALDLASRTNRDIQRIIDDREYRRLYPDTTLNGSGRLSGVQGAFVRNSEMFEVVGHAGSYRAAGVGGGITGMGADILIIDDPIKNAEEANSETVRNSVWEWYTSTAYTRLSPGGGVLIVLTRWHEDDMAGRLLKAAEKNEGDKWEVISFPAIAEEDEDHRKQGEALHPERYGIEQLKAIEATLGSYYWAALYQQRPTPRGGGMIKRHWFEIVRQTPMQVKSRLRWWDRAATKKKAGNDPDWTAGALVSVDADGIAWVEDIAALRESSLDNEKAIRQTADIDGHSIPIYMEQEPGSSGVDVISHYSRAVLQGFDFHGIPSTGAKENFIDIFSAAAEAGNVRIKAGSWNDLFLQQVESYPFGKHDDLLEAAAKAYCRQVISKGTGLLDYYMQQAEEKRLSNAA